MKCFWYLFSVFLKKRFLRHFKVSFKYCLLTFPNFRKNTFCQNNRYAKNKISASFCCTAFHWDTAKQDVGKRELRQLFLLTYILLLYTIVLEHVLSKFRIAFVSARVNSNYGKNNTNRFCFYYADYYANYLYDE